MLLFHRCICRYAHHLGACRFACGGERYGRNGDIGVGLFVSREMVLTQCPHRLHVIGDSQQYNCLAELGMGSLRYGKLHVGVLPKLLLHLLYL